ncbi:MAG TPA: PIN domain nuclease [Nitrospirae bacterium]|nr:PIN domain nuclease [Nitrospirota bacterium]HDH06570.1 PIN domain nuclease [Nitrospirota bacterium]
MDKVLIDTSIWIEFFRKKDPYFEVVRNLIEKDNVCCIGLIYAELLQGAKAEKELSTLRDFMHVFDFIPESAALWEKAGLISYELRRKGKEISLSDCFIASSAVSYSASLFTLDKHFQTIKKHMDLRLYIQ